MDSARESTVDEPPSSSANGDKTQLVVELEGIVEQILQHGTLLSQFMNKLKASESPWLCSICSKFTKMHCEVGSQMEWDVLEVEYSEHDHLEQMLTDNKNGTRLQGIIDNIPSRETETIDAQNKNDATEALGKKNVCNSHSNKPSISGTAKMFEDAQLEVIMNTGYYGIQKFINVMFFNNIFRPPVYLDPEEEYRQKVELMTGNGIVMRGILLSLEAKLALSNKREGILDGFNKSKIENFKEIMKNVNSKFQISGSYLQAYDYKDADMYLARAEADFLDLCPEKESVLNRNLIQNELAANLSEVFINYLPNQQDTLNKKMIEDAQIEEIMNYPPVYLDPEEEYRQQVEQMTWNSIVMRGIVLSMEAKLALSNKREGILDGFNKTKIENFYYIINNVDFQFQRSGMCLQAFNFNGADTYLARAEADFLELCPEKGLVLKRNLIQKKLGGKSSEVFINYLPKERDTLTIRGDTADVLKCLQVAQRAIADEDFGKAEHFINRAERIYETPAAKKLLEQICMLKEAKKAASESKMKAELETAERKTRPEKNATENEEDEKNAREEKEATENKARKEQEAAAKESRQEQEIAKRKVRQEKEAAENNAREASKAKDSKRRRASQCLKQAQEAYNDGDLNAAEKLGNKSQRIDLSAEAEKFLTKVRWELNLITPEGDENLVSNLTMEKKRTDEKYCSENEKYPPNYLINEDVKQLDTTVSTATSSKSSTDNNTVHKNLNISHLDKDFTLMRRAELRLVQAKAAYPNEDLNTAEKIFEVAQQIHPSAEPLKKKLLSSALEVNPNVTKKSNKQTEDVGKRQENKAKDLVRKADVCVASGDFKKAEECLRNARESHPYVDVDTVFTDQDHKSRREKDFILNFTIGTNAMNANEFTKADRFLKIAYGIKPTRNVEDLLRHVQIELGQGNTNTSRGEKDNYSFAFNMLESKQLHRDAKKAFNCKNYDNAEALALQALKYNPLTTTKELLNLIKTAKVAKEQNILEESKPPKTLLSGDKSDEKSKLFNKAQQLLDEGNKDEADNLVHQSKTYGECVEIEKLCIKNELKKSKKKPELGFLINYGPKSTFSHQREDAQKSFEIAKIAFNENDRDKAEHYFIKSNRIFPSDQAKVILQQVRSAKQHAEDTRAFERNSSEHTKSKYVIESEDKIQVDRCIEVAIKAISNEDFEKALHLLQKAQRIQPTEKAKTLLDGIQHSKQQKEENDEKAEDLIALAREAMDKKDYDFAEMLLTTAKIRYNSNSAKHLLTSLPELISRNAQTEKGGSNYLFRLIRPKGTVEKQKIFAEEYYALAHLYFNKGKLEDAETILIIIQNTYPTNAANELLSLIKNEICSRDAGQFVKKPGYEWEFSKKAKQGIENKNAYKSNCYVQMAERAFCNGSYDLAEEFLLEANDLYPCKELKHLLKQVREAKDFINPHPSKKIK